MNDLIIDIASYNIIVFHYIVIMVILDLRVCACMCAHTYVHEHMCTFICMCIHTWHLFRAIKLNYYHRHKHQCMMDKIACINVITLLPGLSMME